MKLLFCQDCGDIIAPHPQADDPRWCRCERHAVWWTDPRKGILRLHDRQYPPSKGWKYPGRPRAYVIGLTNALLHCQTEGLTAETVQQLIDRHDDSYLFKRWRSLVIRIRPGESGDTGWANLPGKESEDAPAEHG